ncbi:MAG: type II secretion system F family protein, partial [Bacteroidota bacterium]
ALSGCVVVPTVPGTSPAPQGAVSLQQQLSGRQLVREGELAGALDAVLLRLADHLEKAEALRRKVRMAMMYPAIVLAVALGTVTFLLTVIVPTFADMFADFGAELPLPTRMVLGRTEK